MKDMALKGFTTNVNCHRGAVSGIPFATQVGCSNPSYEKSKLLRQVVTVSLPNVLQQV